MRHYFRYLAIPLLLLQLLASSYGQSVGSVTGQVTDPTGAVIPNATVTITGAVSGYTQTAHTDDSGQYRFASVPFMAFTVHAEAAGFSHVDQRGELRSNVPLVVKLTLPLASNVTEVNVTEDAPVLETTSAGTHHDLDYEQIQKQVVPQVGRGVEQLVQKVPGVVQDDNGRMHPRGSESQVQYVVDGVPITENLSATFASPLDAGNLRSAEVITGNVPAEYGGKVGAVINVNTKSGLEMPWQGAVSTSFGSFGAQELGIDLGGHTKKLGIYLNADTSRSDRYLDPPELVNFHNSGGNARLFTKLDFNATQHDIFRLDLSADGTDFQVPNTLEQEMLNQKVRQELRDDSESLGWNHIFSNNTVGDFVLYRRASASRLLDPGVTGTPFFATQDRHQRTEGFRGTISRQFAKDDLKFGAEVIRTPLRENFVTAPTDPAILADPTDPASRFSVANPFRFNDHLDGHEAAVFVQNRLKLFDRLTIDAGLRYDHYDFVVEDDHVSPRVGLAYYVKRTGTVIRGSYNNLFQTPPIENLLISSSQAGAALSKLGQATAVQPVPPERQQAYEFGVQQQLWKYLRFDISHYVKTIRNFSDKDQFLDTGIIFPVAIARGDVRGTEFRLDLIEIRGIQAFISYANSRATATTPIVGGLFLGDVSDALLLPGVQFPADHDERNTGQMGLTYSRKDGWITFEGRHDSGVPTDASVSSVTGVDPALLSLVDLNRGRVRPRTVFDLAMGYDLRKESTTPISLQFAIGNITNESYLYNFQSVFSGTHVGRPRDFSGRIVFRFKQKDVKPAS